MIKNIRKKRSHMRQDYSELLFSEMSTFWSHELEKLLYLGMLHSRSY